MNMTFGAAHGAGLRGGACNWQENEHMNMTYSNRASGLGRLLLVLILVVMSLGACSEEPQAPLRVGTNTWPGYEPAYLAREKGYFGEADVLLSEFGSATQTLRAFRNGTIEVAALTLDEVMPLIQDGIDLKIFLVADISNGGDVILARPDIESVADLKGHKIGVESGALGAYVLARALEVHGIPVDQVEPVYMLINESEQAFSAGTVDALVTFEPYRSRLLRTGALEIFSSREIPNEIVDVLVVRTEYAVANPEKLIAFSQAWLKAATFIVEQPQQAATIIGKRHGLSREETLKSMEGLTFPDARINAQMLAKGADNSLAVAARKLISVMFEHNLLMGRVTVDDALTDAYIR